MAVHILNIPLQYKSLGEVFVIWEADSVNSELVNWLATVPPRLRQFSEKGAERVEAYAVSDGTYVNIKDSTSPDILTINLAFSPPDRFKPTV
jgi:hypothetical protein